MSLKASGLVEQFCRAELESNTVLPLLIVYNLTNKDVTVPTVFAYCMYYHFCE